jgi:hypothetical protein
MAGAHRSEVEIGFSGKAVKFKISNVKCFYLPEVRNPRHSFPPRIPSAGSSPNETLSSYIFPQKPHTILRSIRCCGEAALGQVLSP